jgi:uncharacterized membrane protein SpoIIM required for sporulation
MREVAFIKQNADKWKRFEGLLNEKKSADADELAHLYIELTDDLAFANTFYAESKTAQYLNGLTAKVHQKIYINKREERGRIARFWKYEVPQMMYNARLQLWISVAIFVFAVLVGALSAANDDRFARLILGDGYVDMTLKNIEKGDPMAVYKQYGELDMFLIITFNNVKVAFFAFAMGLLLSVGTAYILFQNGVMLGVFQYFFITKGIGWQSALTIWIHGTLEISVIVIAGCAGIVMGNGILFPKTLSRLDSFIQSAKTGLKIVIGTVPIFILAGFLESFVTRHTEMPAWLSLSIIGSSLAFIIWYFILYPIRLHAKQNPT